MRTHTIIAIAIVLVLVTHFSTVFLFGRGVPTQTREAKKDLWALPMQLGDWSGRALPPDKGVNEAVNADAIINREYHNSTIAVTLHAAIFGTYRLTPPHPPSYCLTGSGWHLLSEQDILLPLENGARRRVKSMLLEQRGKRVWVVFWYQFDNQMVFDRYDLRRALWGERGNMVRPPLVKVLLECSAENTESNEMLLRFAASVYEWTKEI